MLSVANARRMVENAGELYECGVVPFTVYDAMRTALTNGQYGEVADQWRRFTDTQRAVPDEAEQRIEDLERENVALRERLAAAQQREQQARAIIALYRSDWPAADEQARAWLADRAEQQAEQRTRAQEASE